MPRKIFAFIFVFAVVGLNAQSGAKKGEWPAYGGDTGHTRYSPLDQINADNFSKLTVAWRFKTDHLGPRPEYQYETTPLMVNGVLYATGGSRRAVVALRHRVSCRAAASRTGPTAGRNAFSMSRLATSWWR